MTDFKTWLKFENKEKVMDFLEDENKKERNGNQIETDLIKEDLDKAKNYYETVNKEKVKKEVNKEEVNKEKEESKGKMTQELDHSFEEISHEKKALVKSKKGIFDLK